MSRTNRRRGFSFFREPHTQPTRAAEHAARLLILQEIPGLPFRHRNRVTQRGNPACPQLPTSFDDLKFSSRERPVSPVR